VSQRRSACCVVSATPFADVLQSVDHPYIVKLRYAWQTSDKLYVVVDYCPGGELFFWLRAHQTFSEQRVQLYAAELVLALDHLHQKNVVYRDLKPENILLDADGHIQLADFGLSKEHVTSFTPGEGATHTFCGTPEYIAPEVLLQKEGHGKGVDWWSLGTFIYEMLNGLPPFYDQNVETMYKKIMTERLVFPDHFSAEACDLLKGMLTRDPAKRLGAGGAKEIMRMPFFAALDWDAVMARQVAAEFTPPTKRAGLTNFDQEFTQGAYPHGSAFAVRLFHPPPLPLQKPLWIRTTPSSCPPQQWSVPTLKALHLWATPPCSTSRQLSLSWPLQGVWDEYLFIMHSSPQLTSSLVHPGHMSVEVTWT